MTGRVIWGEIKKRLAFSSVIPVPSAHKHLQRCSSAPFRDIVIMFSVNLCNSIPVTKMMSLRKYNFKMFQQLMCGISKDYTENTVRSPSLYKGVSK